MTAADLRERRNALGYSTYLMAEILRVSPSALHDWESGAQPITDADREFLDVALDALQQAHGSASPVCAFVMLDGIA